MLWTKATLLDLTYTVGQRKSAHRFGVEFNEWGSDIRDDRLVIYPQTIHQHDEMHIAGLSQSEWLLRAAALDYGCSKSAGQRQKPLRSRTIGLKKRVSHSNHQPQVGPPGSLPHDHASAMTTSPQMCLHGVICMILDILAHLRLRYPFTPRSGSTRPAASRSSR